MPKPVAAPYIDESDLLDLAADLGAGYFPAAYLYDWYVSTIADKGRRPVSKKSFGMQLRASGWQSSLRTVEIGVQARCWLITKPWARRGQEMLAAEMDSRP